MTRYYIDQIGEDGRHITTIAGMGRNRGTLDAECHSLSTARRWLRQVSRENPGNRYTISECPSR